MYANPKMHFAYIQNPTQTKRGGVLTPKIFRFSSKNYPNFTYKSGSPRLTRSYLTDIIPNLSPQNYNFHSNMPLIASKFAHLTA